MESLTVKILNTSNNSLPAYETDGAAGMDVKAYVQQPVKLMPLQRQLIPTGLFIELPSGFEAQVRPRSGLAFKHGITCLNSPGTIDSDYRGEIKVLLINLSQEEHVISNGDRIAQLIISPVNKVSWSEVSVLEETKRGAGGFGHTGK